MTATRDLNTQQFQDLISCSICLDYYRDPRVLPCSHTYCLQCIRGLVKNDAVSCPLRDNTTIRKDEIDKLPINRIAKDMIDFLWNSSSPTHKSQSTPCDNCNQNSAIKWCDECNRHYCESCTQSIHSMNAFKAHRAIALSDKLQTFCSDHSEEKYKYWCNKCEALICRDCLLFQHKDHSFASLKEAMVNIQTQLQVSIQEITEMKQNVINLLNKTEQTIDQETRLAQDQKESVEQTFSTLQRILEERKCSIIQQLDSSSSKTINTLNQRLQDINQYQHLVIARELCMKKILESNDPLSILKLKMTLSNSEDDFIVRYKRMGEVLKVQRHCFDRDSTSLERLSNAITNIDCVNSTSCMLRGYSAVLNPLNVSKSDGLTLSTEKSLNYARGYKFSLNQPLQLHAIEVHTDYIGKHICYVINDTGIVKQCGTAESDNSNMKKLTIPLKWELNNNDSIIVSAPLGNGSYEFKQGDNQPRTVTQHCAVESKCILSAPDTSIGSPLAISNNTYSIEMTIFIEE